MAATNEKRAAFYAVVKPYLEKICENYPQFGSAGITIVFHDGEIARVDITESVQTKVLTRSGARHE